MITDFFTKHWGKLTFSFLFVALLFPLAVSALTKWTWNLWEVPISNDWISFFGSYGGSIVGGLVGALIAVYVARIQIDQQQVISQEALSQQEESFNKQLQADRDSFTSQNKINSRSFLRADTLVFKESPRKKYSNIDEIMNVFEKEVDNLKEDRNRKGAILLLVDYFNYQNRNAIFKSNMTSDYYIVLEHYGNPEAIFDVKIKVTKGPEELTLQCYSFSKDELLLIPDNLYFDTLEVNYTTLIGERMLFTFNRNSRRYILTSTGMNANGVDGRLVDTTMNSYASIHL
jgi:hypothetical protein